MGETNKYANDGELNFIMCLIYAIVQQCILLIDKTRRPSEPILKYLLSVQYLKAKEASENKTSF